MSIFAEDGKIDILPGHVPQAAGPPRKFASARFRGEKEEKGGENRSCLFVELREQAVEPFPTEAEPASCTDLLASESKYKIPISVTSERKSDIHVFQVAITALPGIAQGRVPADHERRPGEAEGCREEA